MKEMLWNLWHGCQKISPGCQNCYVYRSDARHGRNSRVVQQTGDFDLPVRRNRDGSWKVPPGTVVDTCFTSDFFLDQADPWRPEAWRMIDARRDCRFFMITKRPQRILDCLPENWGEGYPHVAIYCTMENQAMVNYRMPIYQKLPIQHKGIICEPLLGPVDVSAHLGSWVEELVAGGESGDAARVCDYDWVLSLRDQCAAAGVHFWFKQTGAFFRKDGRVYRVKRKFQHSQARKANISNRRKI